ncbi:class A beta-lactamase-related serine hydrolase [Streptomyces triticagri]|uniref:Class A beta-lactamase-related serine hydrolase n=1 Tax=Streptomyces triticagri TaxID=2293568 RepID=A0A372M207_9ACTN|nr:serine hydrolase domain-containing protein [Streptomyces triticagri]RFU84931.1 class A beta-lactamase-related serine hydrolase [Streptomyces triticagri]
MRARTRTTLIATALVLGVAAASPVGPAAAGLSADFPGTARTAAESEAGSETDGGPDTGQLAAALEGLPDDDATAALVRTSWAQGSGSWRGSAGVRDTTTGREAVPQARFRAGSTTKVITAALVLQLASEGRIDLDGHVQTYLPGLLDERFEPITVRHLLTYTSGLQPGSSLGAEDGEGYVNRFRTMTPAEVVAGSVAKGPYRGDGEGPGRKQRYANIDYTVLGLLVEKVTGDTYAHQAKRRILRPAGMRHSSFPVGPDPRIHGLHHRGYQKLTDGRVVDATEWNMTDRRAAGDLVSTTEDLEKFLFALFRGELVPKPLLKKEMLTLPKAENATMSAGLQRVDAGGGLVVWCKTGARPGYSTLIAATEDLSRTLVYSVNSVDAKAEETNPVTERIQRAAFSD